MIGKNKIIALIVGVMTFTSMSAVTSVSASIHDSKFNVSEKRFATKVDSEWRLAKASNNPDLNLSGTPSKIVDRYTRIKEGDRSVYVYIDSVDNYSDPVICTKIGARIYGMKAADKDGITKEWQINNKVRNRTCYNVSLPANEGAAYLIMNLVYESHDTYALLALRPDMDDAVIKGLWSPDSVGSFTEY